MIGMSSSLLRLRDVAVYHPRQPGTMTVGATHHIPRTLRCRKSQPPVGGGYGGERRACHSISISEQIDAIMPNLTWSPSWGQWDDMSMMRSVLSEGGAWYSEQRRSVSWRRQDWPNLTTFTGMDKEANEWVLFLTGAHPPELPFWQQKQSRLHLSMSLPGTVSDQSRGVTGVSRACPFCAKPKERPLLHNCSWSLEVFCRVWWICQGNDYEAVKVDQHRH